MLKIKNEFYHKYYLILSNKLSNINQHITFPNPSVGCIVTKNNNIQKFGYTSKNGRPHAEYNCLKSLKKKTENLYVSLEPCVHYGKTPPCINLIVSKKIKRVFCSNLDRDQRVFNKSKNFLKKKHISFHFKKIYNQSIAEYNYTKQKKLPFVIGKIAVSNDGFTSKKNKKLFTNYKSQKFAHILRYQCDSILIGYKTLLNDNPKLNCRIGGISKNIKKFIINKNLNFKKNNLSNKFLKNSYVFHNSIDKKKILILSKNFKLIKIHNFSSLVILKKIYELGYRKLLIEGGVKTHKFFLEKKLINSFFVIRISDKFIKKGSQSFSKCYKLLNLNYKSLLKFRLDDNQIIKYQ